jgi:hypothetical protein
MVVDAGRSQLHILDTSGKTASPSADISFGGIPVAALVLPQTIDSGRDIVVLTSSQTAPQLIHANASLTLNVNTTADIDSMNACTTNLLFLQRGDEVSANTVDFAREKARHSALYGSPSREGAGVDEEWQCQCACLSGFFPRPWRAPYYS